MYSHMFFFVSSGRVKVEDKSCQGLLKTDETQKLGVKGLIDSYLAFKKPNLCRDNEIYNFQALIIVTTISNIAIYTYTK
jgi:hypothetical protein